MEPLTIRIQFFGLHSQVIPGVEFSVQFFLIVNVPLLGYLEELALVTGPTDGVSVDGREIYGFPLSFAKFKLPAGQMRSFRICPLHPLSFSHSAFAPYHPEVFRVARLSLLS